MKSIAALLLLLSLSLATFGYLSVTEAQGSQPYIVWEPPTPGDGESINRNWACLNTTITDSTDTSAFFDWDKSLVGYWPMDFYNDAGVFDNSSYDNLGIFTGTSFGENNITTGKFGQALDFDGSDDHLDVGTFDVSGDELTIEAWFKPDDFSGGPNDDPRIIAKGSDATEDNIYWSLGMDNQDATTARLRFRLKTGGTTTTFTTNTITVNTAEGWIHAVAVYNGSQMALYKNGAFLESTVKTGSISTSSDQVWIGDAPATGDEAFDGLIDEVRVYSRALSPEEINVSYNNSMYRLESNFTGLDEGNYEYAAYAISRDGSLAITSYSQIGIDLTTPEIEWELPTPVNNHIFTGQDWIYVNVSASELIDSCTLDWNGTNESMDVNGNTCHINKTGLENGNITYTVYTSDPAGNMNNTESRVVSVGIEIDYTLPVIQGYYLPYMVPHGDVIYIGVNATDDDTIDSVWAKITDPSSEIHHIQLTNNQLTSWTTSVRHVYNVTIYANDTSGNEVNVTDSIYADSAARFNVSVMDGAGDDVSADMEVFLGGTDKRIFSDSDSHGEFEVDIIEGVFDVRFLVFEDQFGVKLFGVVIDDDCDETFGLDYTSDSGFDHIFAVDTEFELTDADVVIDYDDMDFKNESMVNVYICDGWDFTDQRCDSTWEELVNVTISKASDKASFTVNGFSAFGIREDSYCGDGWCGPGETQNSCEEDCTCIEGTTRQCSSNYDGICGEGTETCTGNQWSGCPSPGTESCNRKDDDCDGVVDNVNSRSSVSATQCQCYGDRSPLTEICNGIDDDCDGEIDEGSNCCDDDQTR